MLVVAASTVFGSYASIVGAVNKRHRVNAQPKSHFLAQFVTGESSLPEIDDPFCADDHLPNFRSRPPTQ